MRRVFIVPNVITAFSLACGLFVIFKVNMIEPGTTTYKALLTSTILILVASFADWVDGTIARAIHAESEFGFLFDSLSDAVSFGVAPSVLMLKTFSLERGTPLSFFAIIGAMVFSICGILRLVRFNVTMAAVKKLPKYQRKKFRHFIGFPIPAAALTIVGTNLLFSYPKFQAWFPLLDETFYVVFMASLSIGLGYLMVSRVKFPSAKFLHFRVPSFQLVFGAVLVAFFLLYGILYFFPLALTVLMWLYLLAGLLILVVRRFTGRKSKIFKDFEPHHDN